MDAVGSQKEAVEAKHIVLAGGCFWGLQALMDSFKGIGTTVVGYANASMNACGTKSSSGVESQTVSFLKRANIPAYELSYQAVCSGATNAAEAVAIEYDERVITLESILDIFFAVVDPTSKNSQGNDVGTQYRSGIYYLPCEKDDLSIINTKVQELQLSYKKPIVTEVAELKNYSVAEEMHQKYLASRPNGYCHIDVSAARERFAHLL
ncbi:Peptide methionine sulfoxide reductase msrA [Giardia lamblia P15]|uniref:peptide-methionine (S)-S-oxide reductase n=1 Tax=Giardia intestinalis (strain P15) TaxID=658858 RepID=E1F7P9_GIAIA|nr:Peptide methionine sulfoxide reductase msrA [Giardia lamblia P15]